MKKTKPRVIFRADAGSKTGFGHLVRSAALASYLRDDFNCLFVCHTDTSLSDSFITGIIEEAGAERIIIDTVSLTDKSERNLSVLDKVNDLFLSVVSGSDIVVLDNYYFDGNYQNNVRNRAGALVTIDDMPDREFVSDVFFTPSPRKKNEFNIAGHTDFYGGIEWTFLRQPFLRLAADRKKGKLDTIVIAMGGADPLNLTGKIIRIIRKINEDVKVQVIAGPTVTIGEGKGVEIFRNMSSCQLAELFDKADFGIFSASTMSLEALSRKLPIAAGWYVDNQYGYYKIAVEKGLFADLGDLRRNDEELENDLRNIIENIVCAEAPDLDFTDQKQKVINIFKNLWKNKVDNR